MHIKQHISVVAVSTLLFSGCAVSENMGKIGGGTIGAITGAAIGKKLAGDNGAIIGGVIGLSFGYLIGDEIDKRRNAIKSIAQKQQNKTNLSFNNVIDENGKKVGQSISINTEQSQFDSGKYYLNSYASPMFIEIAKEYAKSGMKVMIIGHTDADGSDSYNQRLSENRAKTIAKLFEKNGVPLENIYYKGSGENEPVATNENTKGKAKNRRVEIVEATTEKSLAKYALNRPINVGLYSSKNKNNNIINSTKNDEINSNNSNPPLGMPVSGDSGNMGSAQKVNLKGGLPLGKANKANNSPNQKAGTGKNGSLSSLPLLGGMGGPGIPKIPGTKKSKFGSIDKKGNPSGTNVAGNYYKKENKIKNKLGSCNNEYAYSKNSTFDVKGEKTKNYQNQLLSVVGAPVHNSVFSLVTPAVADENMLAFYGSCLNDKVKKEGDIKSLKTGEKILFKENYNMAPALNGTAWAARIDKEFLMINPIGVRRSNLKSETCPELSLIKKGANQPWYGTNSEVVSYNGEDGLLYRLYPKDKRNVQCIDIAFPHGNPQNAKGIIYFKNKEGVINHKKINFFSLNKSGGSI